MTPTFGRQPAIQKGDFPKARNSVSGGLGYRNQILGRTTFGSWVVPSLSPQWGPKRLGQNGDLSLF